MDARLKQIRAADLYGDHSTAIKSLRLDKHGTGSATGLSPGGKGHGKRAGEETYSQIQGLVIEDAKNITSFHLRLSFLRSGDILWSHELQQSNPELRA